MGDLSIKFIIAKETPLGRYKVMDNHGRLYAYHGRSDATAAKLVSSLMDAYLAGQAIDDARFFELKNLYFARPEQGQLVFSDIEPGHVALQVAEPKIATSNALAYNLTISLIDAFFNGYQDKRAAESGKPSWTHQPRF